jgi:hypothetical protein
LNAKRKTWWMTMVGLALPAASLTWSGASEVVVLHPAVLRAQFSYSSEPVSHLQVLARPQAGGLESSATVTAPSSPFSVDVIVDGGDGAAGASNPGINYVTSVDLRHLNASSMTG